MKITEADVVWTRATEPAPEGGTSALSGTVRAGNARGATVGFWRPALSISIRAEDDPTTQLLSLFVLFNTLVIRDGIDPNRAHEAFLAIDEYRQTISPEIPGAEE
jgi:hypothetical protein